ncbi:MFS transporter [Scopulibacillus cellulosilyticus]|uniref:MFS transporter n=1 Tax=Scopulibacillus cellulosilyticus TaxID=2665665 RepID=A0ABW2Q0L7_9BACL
MKTTNVRWRIVLLIMFPMQLMMQMDRINISVSASLIQKDFGFSLAEMGLVLSAFAWTYALFQIPAGIWVQRIGSRKAVAIAGILWSLCTLITPFASTLILLLIFRGLLGIAQAADIPGGINAINNWFPKREKAKANSIFLSSGYLAAAIGTTLTAWIVSHFGWQWGFYGYGIIGIAVGVYWYVSFRNSPHEHKGVNQEELKLINEGKEPDPSKNNTKVKTSWKDWKVYFSKCQFWAIGFQYFCLVLIESFYITLLPTFLVQSRGLTIGKIGIVAALPWIALAISVFVMGNIIDFVYKKTNSRYLSRVPFGIAGFVISSGCLWLAIQASSVISLSIFLMISMAGIGMIQVPNWSAVQDIGGKHNASLSGFVNFCGNASTAVGTILVLEIVSLTGSWTIGILLITVMGVLGAMSWLLIKPDKPLLKSDEIIIKNPDISNQTL